MLVGQVGPHLVTDAGLHFDSGCIGEVRANLTDEHRAFLSALSGALSDCEWTDAAIGDCIRATIGETGIGGRDAYVALYWVILGKNHGPRASSLMAEMESRHLLSLISE